MESYFWLFVVVGVTGALSNFQKRGQPATTCYLADFCHSDFKNEIQTFKIGGYLTSWKNKIIVTISDQDRLGVINSDGSITYVGKRGGGTGEFNNPMSTTVYNNNLYVADNGNSRIQIFNENFIYVSKFDTKFQPRDIIFHEGYFYVTDFLGKRIHKLTRTGVDIFSFSSRLVGPQALVWDETRNNIIVSDNTAHNLKIYASDGNFLKSSQKISNPHELLIDGNGNIMVTEHTGNRLLIFDNDLNLVCEKTLPYKAFGLAIMENCSLAIGKWHEIRVYSSPTTDPLTTVLLPTIIAHSSTAGPMTSVVPSSSPILTSESAPVVTSESATVVTSQSVPVVTSQSTATESTIQAVTEDLVSPTSSPVETYCAENWFKHGNFCYIWSADELGWFGAEKQCQKLGGHLISLSNAEENVFAHSLSQCRDKFWLGLVLLETGKWTTNSAWHWWDGTKHNFSKLKINSKKENAIFENCVFQTSNGEYWVHENCRTENKFICKAEALKKPTESIGSPCPDGWQNYKSHCYWLSDEKVNYFHAQLSCQEKNSTVVTIHSEGEQVFNQILHGCKEKVWIGLEHTKPCLSSNNKKCWEWIDLSQIKYTKWLPGNPGTNLSYECAFNNGGWTSTSCDNSFKYICKK